MGLAGVRTPDNAELFDAKKPLVVVYFSVDYTHNPKGERTLLYGNGSLSLVLSLLQLMDGMLSDISLFHPPASSHSPTHRQQLLEKQVPSHFTTQPHGVPYSHVVEYISLIIAHSLLSIGFHVVCVLILNLNKTHQLYIPVGCTYLSCGEKCTC